MKKRYRQSTREIDAAQQEVPGTVSYTAPFPWQPIVDGKLIPAQPYELLKSGRFKRNVATLSGCNDDEETLFATSSSKFTDEAGFKKYSKDSLSTTDERYARLSQLYPADPAAGSPYNTGFLNQRMPQSKRVASLVSCGARVCLATACLNQPLHVAVRRQDFRHAPQSAAEVGSQVQSQRLLTSVPWIQVHTVPRKLPHFGAAQHLQLHRWSTYG